MTESDTPSALQEEISIADLEMLKHAQEGHHLITGKEVDLRDPRAIAAVRDMHTSIHNNAGCGHFHV